MNKKKIVSLCLIVCLLATAVVGGTLAYFTDTDADVNVMTAGNVQIVQNETDRKGDAYVDGQKLIPAVYLDGEGNPYNPSSLSEGPAGGTTGSFTGPDGKELKMYDTNINNEIDKVISVTNGGTEDAYVRTIVLLENRTDADGVELTNYVHALYSDSDDVKMSWINEVTPVIDGEKKTYEVLVFTYQNALAAGETSAASLRQVWLDPMADNGWYDMLEDGVFEIIALSQAVQEQGFEEAGAEVALNTAFGEVTDDNLTEWLAETPIKTSGLNNVVAG